MSAVYTPGLKVSDHAVLVLERRLPLTGTVTVKEGEMVRYDQVVAKTELPGRVDLVNVANKLGIEPADVPASLAVPIGGQLEKGQPLARSPGIFGMFRATLPAPMSGTIESVSEVTGQVVLRAAPQPVEVRAYVDGKVEEVLPGEGVVLRTFGTLVQGILGIGGETSGQIEPIGSRDQPLSLDLLQESHRAKVLVGGSLITREFLEKAVSLGVAAVITGGIDDEDLRSFLGYDLGVAITGSENKGITLVLTEGFGEIAMAQRTFDLLTGKRGQRASVSGATQIRAGVIRPEIFVPRLEGTWEEAASGSGEGALEVGVRVRVIREPGFGSLARVAELPSEAQTIPTEAKVRVAVIELDSGERLTLPRANLERVEE